ncbi:YifB family Mg chelatase-like AAA ATPase [Gulosibacter sp. GYB002]|uniref:YifB family Mg chelatase-like AAA ATPase n=1 Tax=Gulosibacter sp. GYB002 TaxID=2994391 RepID=UPI002F9621FC
MLGVPVRTWAMALQGLGGQPIEVQAVVLSGLPRVIVVGLPDAAIGESADRIRAAFGSLGKNLPPHRITLNLSPVDLPKHGAGFDLAMAVSLLAVSGVINAAAPSQAVHIGELGLDGAVLPVRGVLPAVAAARDAGYATAVVPRACASEAELVSGIRIVAVSSLHELASHYGGEIKAAPPERPALAVAGAGAVTGAAVPDLADVLGMEDAVRALVIAAAGRHHLSMIGPPGSGKTMLAERLPGILPQLDVEAAVTVAALQSLCGIPIGNELNRTPPFQAPHHSATQVALVGGGSGNRINPGAISLASHGVLFLDEAPEFARTVLDALRQPLESGEITIHRARTSATYPANPQLVLAANPCPCGNADVPGAECSCAPSVRHRYLRRLSGPLLDRIDLQVRVVAPSVAAMRLTASGERGALSTADAAAQVLEARERARLRLAPLGFAVNAEVDAASLRRPELRPEPGAAQPLDQALERGLITMRGYTRVQRTAWTIADLAGADRPIHDHITEALWFRTSTRN